MQELAEITSDPDAFESFYRQHVEAVQRFVARRVADPYLVADLTAGVFVAVIESAGLLPAQPRGAGGVAVRYRPQRRRR